MVSEQDSSRTIKASASILYYKIVKEWLGVNDQNHFSNSCDTEEDTRGGHEEKERQETGVMDVTQGCDVWRGTLCPSPRNLLFQPQLLASFRWLNGTLIPPPRTDGSKHLWIF